jgi:zinc protease
MMFREAIRTAGLAALCACWSTPRPAAPRGDFAITIDVQQFALANGLRVLIVPEADAGAVSVTIRYAVGSADDPAGREGLAHLSEHVVFEHVREQEALFDYLESHALNFNGFTTADSTLFTERAPSAELENLLALEAARVQQDCAAIPASSFAKQRDIVRNEVLQRAADDSVQAALTSAVFGANHRFAGRVASAASIETITQDDVCSFVAEHYTARNAVLVLSGALPTKQVRAVVDRTLGGLPPGKPASEPAVATPSQHETRIESAVDRPWVVLAWPLPSDAVQRTRMRAAVEMATLVIGARVNGIVSSLDIGPQQLRYIAIAIAPSSEISVADALDTTKTALSHIGDWFISGVFEYARSRQLYRFAASLDHGIERDSQFAADVSAGAPLQSSLTRSMQALQSMSRADVQKLLEDRLDIRQATTVFVDPSKRTTRFASVLTPPIREERRRRRDDPAEAHRPAEPITHPELQLGATSRTLPNGLHVVLLPISTMPTVDIRLVFPVGTADEPSGERGVASVAARALYAHVDPDVLRFIQLGGAVEKAVTFDQTQLAVRGLAANLDDYLLGLSATVRGGGYDVDGVRGAVHDSALESSSDPAVERATDAWRQALYGVDHPYRAAGVWRFASRTASDVETVARFRARHYAPDGATLIIAGRFDPENADRWVDYYFADWSGSPASRNVRRATLQALAFAQPTDAQQLELQIALPGARDHEASLLATAMIEESIADIREQLAATYGLHAQFVERRLSSTIEIWGYVDSTRAPEALALLRDRLALLRDTGDDTARLFVSARRHVLARLSSVDTRASALADEAAHDAALDRGSSRKWFLDRVRMLTIDQVRPMLENMDLTHAAIVMRGPRAALAAAYAAIGREPTMLR